MILTEVNKKWILDRLKIHDMSDLLVVGSRDSWWKLDRFFMFYDLRYKISGYNSAALTKLIFN